jgi:hypothetical protein
MAVRDGEKGGAGREGRRRMWRISMAVLSVSKVEGGSSMLGVLLRLVV